MSCGFCTAEIPAGYTICWDHTAPLQQHLAELDSTIQELRTTMARQDVGSPSHGSGSTTPQPAINLDALEAYEQLRTVIIGWAVALQGRAFYWITTTETAGSYLLANLDMVRRQDWACDLAAELAQAVRGAVNATDRAADKISLGTCPTEHCGDEVTAIVGEVWGRCRTCTAQVNVRDHQRTLIDSAWNVRAPLAKVIRALKAGGHLSVPLARAEKWVERGSLGPVIPFVGLYTMAAVMEAYERTPSGKKAKAQRNTTLSHVA